MTSEFQLVDEDLFDKFSDNIIISGIDLDQQVGSNDMNIDDSLQCVVEGSKKRSVKSCKQESSAPKKSTTKSGSKQPAESKDEVDSLLDSIMGVKDISDVIGNVGREKYNYCTDCNVAMNFKRETDEYHCPKCGLIREGVGGEVTAHNEEGGYGCIRILSSVGAFTKSKCYNIGGDYAKVQRKFILDQLIQNNNQYQGPKIPRDILVRAASSYNDVQKLIIDDEVDAEGNVSQKKFVRRGNIKDEVLSAFVYYECIRGNVTRKKKDIATFMKLPSSGFSRGEDILRSLNAEGKINIPTDEEPMEDFVDRYLEALGLDNPDNAEYENYKNFIIDLVQETEDQRVGMNSQISSKVVGAIWMLIVGKKLNKTSSELEKAADSCKKNTYMKFCKAVDASMGKFKDIFEKYGVKLR